MSGKKSNRTENGKPSPEDGEASRKIDEFIAENSKS